MDPVVVVPAVHVLGRVDEVLLLVSEGWDDLALVSRVGGTFPARSRSHRFLQVSNNSRMFLWNAIYLVGSLFVENETPNRGMLN